MDKQSVFEFQSYKEIMKAKFEERRGQLSRAAEALNCQVSFLSRVLKTEAHLTLDQAFMVSKFWKFNPEEQDYFQSLVEFERDAEPQYREHLKLRIDKQKQNNESLQKRTRKENFPIAEQQAMYFSTWLWSAIHFLSAIPEYQSSKKMAVRLGVSESIIIDNLKKLELFKLVSSGSHNQWKYASGQFHLPKHSPFVVQHHQNWRNKAIMDAQNFSSEGLHYTTVLTLSKKDVEKIKNLLLSFISDTVEISNPSSPEEAVVLNCDFFKV